MDLAPTSKCPACRPRASIDQPRRHSSCTCCRSQGINTGFMIGMKASDKPPAPLGCQGSRPSPVNNEGRTANTSVSCLRCIFRNRAGRNASPGGMNTLVRAPQPSSLPAPCFRSPLHPAQLQFPLHLPAPSSYSEGPTSMPLPRPLCPCGMLSCLFADNLRFAIPAQPPARRASLTLLLD